MVDAHDEHGGIIAGGRDDDLLGTSLKVSRGGVGVLEDASGLHNVVRAGGSPSAVRGVLLGGEGDFLAVHNEAVAVVFDGALELAVRGVVLEHVREVLRVQEGVVDGGDLDVGVLHGRAEHQAANAAEAVDTNADGLAHLAEDTRLCIVADVGSRFEEFGVCRSGISDCFDPPLL